MKWKNGRVEVEKLENVTREEMLSIVTKQVSRTANERKVHDTLLYHPNAAPLNELVSSAVAHQWDGMVYLQSSLLEKEIVQTIETKMEAMHPLRFVEEVVLNGTAHFFYMEGESGAGFRTFASRNVIEVVSKTTGELAYLLIESSEPDNVHVIWVTEKGFHVYKGDHTRLEQESAVENKAGRIQKVTQSFHHGNGWFAGLESDILALCRKGKSEKKRGEEVERIRSRTAIHAQYATHHTKPDEQLANWQLMENLKGYQRIRREIIELVEGTLLAMADIIQRNDYPDAREAEFTLMLFKRQSIEDEMLWNPKSKERDMVMYFGEGYERHFLIPPTERQKLPDAVRKEMNRKYPRSLYRTK